MINRAVLRGIIGSQGFRSDALLDPGDQLVKDIGRVAPRRAVTMGQSGRFEEPVIAVHVRVFSRDGIVILSGAVWRDDLICLFTRLVSKS